MRGKTLLERILKECFDSESQVIASFLISMSVGMMLVFFMLDLQLKTVVAPYGIVSFELAGAYGGGRELVMSWNARQKSVAAFVLGLDYLFIPVYCTTLAYCCIWTARTTMNKPWLVETGIGIGLGQYLAGILDVVENTLLFLGLLNPDRRGVFTLATICAIGKFLIVLTGLGFTLYGATIHYQKKQQGRKRSRSHRLRSASSPRKKKE